jgi:hypothetical protein
MRLMHTRLKKFSIVVLHLTPVWTDMGAISIPPIAPEESFLSVWTDMDAFVFHPTATQEYTEAFVFSTGKKIFPLFAIPIYSVIGLIGSLLYYFFFWGW